MHIHIHIERAPFWRLRIHCQAAPSVWRPLIRGFMAWTQQCEPWHGDTRQKFRRQSWHYITTCSHGAKPRVLGELHQPLPKNCISDFIILQSPPLKQDTALRQPSARARLLGRMSLVYPDHTKLKERALRQQPELSMLDTGKGRKNWLQKRQRSNTKYISMREKESDQRKPKLHQEDIKNLTCQPSWSRERKLTQIINARKKWGTPPGLTVLTSKCVVVKTWAHVHRLRWHGPTRHVQQKEIDKLNVCTVYIYQQNLICK